MSLRFPISSSNLYSRLEKIYFLIYWSSNNHCLPSSIMTSSFSLESSLTYKGEKNRLMVKWPDPTSALRLALS